MIMFIYIYLLYLCFLNVKCVLTVKVGGWHQWMVGGTSGSWVAPVDGGWHQWIVDVTSGWHQWLMGGTSGWWVAPVDCRCQ